MGALLKCSILVLVLVSGYCVVCQDTVGKNQQATNNAVPNSPAPTIIENGSLTQVGDVISSNKASSPLDLSTKDLADVAIPVGTPNAQQSTIDPATGMIVTTNAPGQPQQSNARTFDNWTSCKGYGGGKHGTCKNDVECKKAKGIPDGSCMGGLGVCCVMALTCNEKSSENNTFFANPDFPEPSWEARQCEVEIKKKSSKTLQIMIEFEEFDLAPPNFNGECITDVFQVRLASQRPSPYSLLKICGFNTGQHMYLDVSKIDEPLVLSMATSGGGYPRKWSIRIVHIDDKNHLLAPPGCLQYYTDTVGHYRSFNLGKNLRNLYYAICFRIDHGYSGIRFTSNFFGMNGPMCRRREQSSGFGLGKGHPRLPFIPSHHYPGMPPHFGPGPVVPFPSHGPRFGGYPGGIRSKRDSVDSNSTSDVSDEPQPTFVETGPLIGENNDKSRGTQEKRTSEKQHNNDYEQPHGQRYGRPQHYDEHHHGEKYDKYEHEHEHEKYDEHHHTKEEEKEFKKEEKAEKKGWFSWANKKEEKKHEKHEQHHEALFPMIRMLELPPCEPRFCGANDVITFPPSGDSMAEMCGNTFNRGRKQKTISGSPLVVYVSNRGHQRGSGFDMNYEQIFHIPRPY